MTKPSAGAIRNALAVDGRGAGKFYFATIPGLLGLNRCTPCALSKPPTNDVYETLFRPRAALHQF
jgi:hypothetical protein